MCRLLLVLEQERVVGLCVCVSACVLTHVKQAAMEPKN